MSRFLFVALTLLLLSVPSQTMAGPPTRAWMSRLGGLPIQDGGRVMPLDTYARNLAVELTGRTSFPASTGPEGFAGKHHMELLCDLLFRPQDVIHKPIVVVDSAAFRAHVGLDAKARFFAPTDLISCRGISDVLASYEMDRARNPDAKASPLQRQALDVESAVTRIDVLSSGQPLSIVPGEPGKAFRRAGLASGDPGTEEVTAALSSFGRAYLAGQDLDAAAERVVQAVERLGKPTATESRAVGLELLYNQHKPWRMTAIAYTLALVLLGLSRLVARRPLVIAALLAMLWGVAEHVAGLSLRVAILGRAPVSNTYEALLWMGLVAIGVSLVAQLVNRKAWYLVSGITVALLSVLFSNLVSLENQTGSLPAVLRSNYWLIVHVLTIVASYGVLAVASILGHVYLIKDVLLARRGSGPADSRTAHPVVSQTYRCIQLGLVLLTAGTILGGVWAADSWGRFWGWDPKETWALICIVVYFAVLHARYVRWLRDFGLAASAVLGFASVVWCFYGVNYLMGAGLHSYGFGAGGGTWVGAWVIAEALLVIACRLRLTSRVPAASPDTQPAPGQPAHTA